VAARREAEILTEVSNRAVIDHVAIIDLREGTARGASAAAIMWLAEHAFTGDPKPAGGGSLVDARKMRFPPSAKHYKQAYMPATRK
jgi:hypothetical protein